MTHRPEQFISYIKKELAIFLRKIAPINIGIFFTINDITISKSGDDMIIMISVYPQNAGKDTIKILKTLEADSREHLGGLLKHRKIPRLSFVLDETQAERVRLEKLLENKEND